MALLWPNYNRRFAIKLFYINAYYTDSNFTFVYKATPRNPGLVIAKINAIDRSYLTNRKKDFLAPTLIGPYTHGYMSQSESDDTSQPVTPRNHIKHKRKMFLQIDQIWFHPWREPVQGPGLEFYRALSILDNHNMSWCANLV